MLLMGSLYTWNMLCCALTAILFYPLLYIAPTVFTRVVDECLGCMVILSAWLVERWAGIELVFSGDEFDQGAKRTIVVSNHICSADFMFHACIARRSSNWKYAKAVMKATIKYVFPIGTFAWLANFPAVRKKFEDDAASIKYTLQAATHYSGGLHLLIYPEGMFMTPGYESTVEKSQQWAEKQGYPGGFSNVLFPRTKGVEVCVEGLGTDMDCLYDVTLAFPEPYSVRLCETALPSLVDVLSGRLPPSTTLYIHMTKVTPKEVLGQAEQWCKEAFARKEALLQHFQEHGQFPGPNRSDPIALSLGRALLPLATLGITIPLAIWGLAGVDVLIRVCMYTALIYGAFATIILIYMWHNEGGMSQYRKV